MTKTTKVQQMSDHDLLIRVDAKVDQLSLDIREVKDGTTIEIANHEHRLLAIERVHDETNPKKAIEELAVVKQWQHDFNFKWRFIIAAAAFIGGLVSWIFSNVHLLNISLK